MARLFVTDRELRLIADINREVIRDVIGQKIYYFPVSVLKTKVHEIYNEAERKVFDNPIEIACLVDAAFQQESDVSVHGVESKMKLEVFIQWRDLVESGVVVTLGDYFTYGDVLYEIQDNTFIKTIYGQVEHKDGIKLVGVKARQGALRDVIFYGPTDIKYSDEDAVQHSFTQSRGNEEGTDENPTGDVRELVRDGVLDPPLTGPKTIVDHTDVRTDIRVHGQRGDKVSSFYGDEED